VKILGCHFHFVKALWGKAAKIGLKKKDLKDKTAIVIGLLILIVHIQTQHRQIFFEVLRSIYKDEEGKYQQLF
jgi:hypothetical protein